MGKFEFEFIEIWFSKKQLNIKIDFQQNEKKKSLCKVFEFLNRNCIQK